MVKKRRILHISTDVVATSNLVRVRKLSIFNPLHDMPILGPSNSAENNDMMSKIWTNWDTII